jgi:TonB-linked SusC/RagA family outer membrane protein
MKKFLLFLVQWILCSTLLAQTMTVTGRITSAEDETGLPGVNIIVEGTSHGTVTDLEGFYSIEAESGQVLVFSSVGYVAEKVLLENQSVINLAMSPDVTTLEEMVVIGYGTQKKRDVIGSVSSIKSEELTQVPSPSLEGMMQGLATGVSVSQSSGVPGAPVTIKIRGLSSISLNTNPLWIVDGMPIYSGGGLENTQGSTGQSPLSMINPNDIESIDVLKDAKATAIYGSRGNNGVIIITTKSGKGSKGTTSVDYHAGITDLTRTPGDIGFANTQQWFELVETARFNSSKTEQNPEGAFTPFDPRSITAFFKDDPTYHLTRAEALAVNTDWFGEILRKGYYHDLNVSSSRGFEKGAFYISGAYRNDNSVLKENQLQRLSVRANLNFQPVNNLEVGARLSFAYTQNNRQKTQSGGAAGNNNGGAVGGFGQANRGALPWFPIYNHVHSSGYWNPMSGSNLTANIDPDLMLDIVDQYRGIGNVYMDYRVPFVDGLSLRGEISGDFIQNNSVFWIADVLRELGSYAFERAATVNNTNYNLYATFSRNFGDNHNILAVIGTESQRFKQYTRDLEGQNLTGTYQQLGIPQDKLSMHARLSGEEFLRAYFGRIDYKFMDRYLAGLSFRRDGSSKFRSEKRWGFFPAASAGWIISDEAFMTNVPVLTFLKLRASYGITGNKDVNSNLFETLYVNRVNWRYGTDDLIAAGTRVTNIGNPDLTWETASTVDFGFDFGLLDDRISGSAGYYIRTTTDLLLSSPLPNSAGVEGGNIWDNVGDLQNFGFEFDIRSVNVSSNNWKWTTNFNVSTNDSRILTMTPDLDRSGRGMIRGNEILKTDGRINTYFMAEDAGVDPEKGVNMIWEIDYDLYERTGETVKTGRKIPATKTNLQRHRIIHENKTSVPRVFGGLNNTLRYRGFDFSILFSFNFGNYIYDYQEQRATDVQYGQVVLRTALIDNTWTPDHRDARYPELRWQGNYDWDWDPDIPNPDWTGDPEDPRAMGYWVKNGNGNYKNETENWTKYLYRGDFIRLRNVQLGYNIPGSILSRAGFDHIRVYISGTNLWTWTPEYTGWDPESGGWNLPLLKVYSAGINVQF